MPHPWQPLANLANDLFEQTGGVGHTIAHRGVLVSRVQDQANVELVKSNVVVDIQPHAWPDSNIWQSTPHPKLEFLQLPHKRIHDDASGEEQHAMEETSPCQGEDPTPVEAAAATQRPLPRCLHASGCERQLQSRQPERWWHGNTEGAT